MALLDWKESYSVGVPEVDHEHRELIELINALHREMEHSQARDRVTAFLGEIYARISAHFALEERVMREHRYDQYRDHKDDHERLLDEIRDIMDGYELERRYDDAALAAILGEWFGEHFRTRDARLHHMIPAGHHG